MQTTVTLPENLANRPMLPMQSTVFMPMVSSIKPSFNIEPLF
jgi:hypothetical protein